MSKHTLRIPSEAYAILVRRAKIAGCSPTAVLAQAINTPEAYQVLCDIDKSRNGTPKTAVPTKQEIKARAKKRIDELLDLNTTIMKIYLTYEEAPMGNLALQHAKILALQPHANCPDWIDLHNEYLGNTVPTLEHVERVRAISQRAGAEMTLLRAEPEKVLDIPEGSPLPFLK